VEVQCFDSTLSAVFWGVLNVVEILDDSARQLQDGGSNAKRIHSFVSGSKVYF